MTNRPLLLYTVFHHNLAFSSIEEEQRTEVVRRCYLPLLQLASKYELPLGIEATAYTLESAAQLEPRWLEDLRRLTRQGLCEFIGSGYAQVIGPLVPPEVNAANLRLGLESYQKLLGFRPEVALVNEQAYSAGLVQHYLETGFRAIIMEWNNPARSNTGWDPLWRYYPQLALGQHAETIPVIWNKSVAFQKFQRYVHGEMELGEYLDYVFSHVGDSPRAFPLYGNDVEVFDFRPGRFHTEAALEAREWERIEQLVQVLKADRRVQFVAPSRVLELLDTAEAGHPLRLESAEQPIPVKKQGKYNILRWAITGRDDLGINTACWRVYEQLKRHSGASDNDWRELCYCWSSDFRTHITEKRWQAFRSRLRALQTKVGALEPNSPNRSAASDAAVPGDVKVERSGRHLTVETDQLRVVLNCRRGLAIDRLSLKQGNARDWLCGTLHHGYYDDIDWAADYYTGHLVLEIPGQSKITDLNPCNPSVGYDSELDCVVVRGDIATPLGPIQKEIGIHRLNPRLTIRYSLQWNVVPIGALRLGHITLNPQAFDPNSLLFRTHNGGYSPETFTVARRRVEHDRAVSFLVSARSALGVTSGMVELGDARRVLRVEFDKSMAALVGMITHAPVGDTYFYRLTLSAQEFDETSRPRLADSSELPALKTFALSIRFV